MNLLELPTEMLLAVLEWLVKLDPVVLLGSVPGVCRRMRALCAGVRGEFDLRGDWERLDGRGEFDLRGEWERLDGRDECHEGDWSGLKGALSSAARMFPRTKGLWTFGESPLHDACEAGLLAVVGRLLEEEGSRVDDGNGYGAAPLYSACLKGHMEIVLLLVEKGADVDTGDHAGWTPLHIACVDGHLEIVRLLVEKGADMDKETVDGDTSLWIACENGHLEVARLLLEKGADMDKADINGCTPLKISRDRGHAEIVALLEQAGARA